MAHMIDFSNARANMAFRGENPWHGLGSRLTDGAPLEQWQREAGMLHECALATVAYKPRIAGMADADARVRIADDQRVLYRNDTGAALGIVSPDYKIVQPREVIHFFRDLTERHGWEMETAGCLKGGRVAWALAKATEQGSLDLGGADISRPYLLLSTSFDGSRATEARFTAVRVVCHNTISAAWSSKANVKVRHSSEFNADRAKVELKVGDAWAEYCAAAKLLASTPAGTEHTLEVLFRAYFDKSADAMRADENAKAQVKRLLERVEPVLARAPGQNTDAARGSLWGVVNAVTYDVDHTYPTRGAAGTENRFMSAQFGLGDQIKRRAMQAAMLIAA